MSNKPICHAIKTVAKSRLFEIEQMDLEFSNGQLRSYERIASRSLGAVLIVAVTANDEFILVKEYCAGTERYELGFPKGLIDAGEDCLQAANRELQEEVGFAANHLKLVKKMTLAPGYFGAEMDVVFASGLYSSKLTGDEPEPLEVVYWPRAKFHELINHHDFTEARSIAALMLVKEFNFIGEENE